MMRYIKLPLILSVVLLCGGVEKAHAHGFQDDGHITTLDYIQIVGIGVISLGLLAYSFDKWRKDKNNQK